MKARGWLSLGVALALWCGASSQAGASPVAEQELRYAAEAVARTLTLVAAEGGPERALAFSGEASLPSLAPLLEAAAQAPRARDLRQMGGDLELQAGLLDAVLADVELVVGGQRRTGLELLARFRDDVTAGLLDELSWLEARQRGVSLDAESLIHDLEGIPSVKEIRARKGGARLCLYASQAPLLERRLAVATPWGRLEHGLRLFDREALPQSSLFLRLLERCAASPELAAVSDKARVGVLRDALALQLTERFEELSRALGLIREGCRKVRTQELRTVVAGRRGPPLAEVLPLIKAYRRAFEALPDLEATPYWDVYQDRNDARLHFWLPAEERWVRGPQRVDPLPPVVEALLASPDPSLQLRATRSHALAQLYGLFPEPFSAARREWDEQAGALFAWIRAARAACAPGLRPGLEAALGQRLGVPPELFGAAESDPEGARQALDHLLRVGLSQGAGAARALRAELGRLRAEVTPLALRCVRLRLSGLPSEVPVDLAWSPAPRFPAHLDPNWLVAPPFALRPGSEAAGVALGSAPLSVEAYALDGEVKRGEARFGAGGEATLALAPGPVGIGWADLGPGRLRAWTLPREAPALELFASGPGGRSRPLDATEILELTPSEPGGVWTLEARASEGEVRAQRAVELAPRTGVALVSPWPATPGEELVAEVQRGGVALPGPFTWRVIDGGGATLHEEQGRRLSWLAESGGRFELRVVGAPEEAEGERARIAPFALGVNAGPGSLRVGSEPWDTRQTLFVGEPAFLRLDLWPVCLAEEVLEVRWTIRAGDKERSFRVRPQPGRPATALRLPIRSRAGASLGKRVVSARVLTARGELSLEGTFQLVSGGEAVALRTEGEPLLRLPRAEAGGAHPGLQVRAEQSPRSARWHLVGPAGDVRALPARPDRGVEVSLLPQDLEGHYELWFHGESSEGAPLFGWLPLRGVGVAALSVPAPRAARIGERVTLSARPPRGFEGPFQIRLAGQSWSPGRSLELEVRGSNTLSLELLDARGRLAQGSLSFEGAAPDAARGVKVGIVADARLKRIFLVDHAQLQGRGADKLPRGWVPLEAGPLTLSVARGRIWSAFPYDGPSPKSQVAYRTQRFWAGLQRAKREALVAAGLSEGTPLEVMITPASAGEETLPDRVGRLLGESGGWTYRLSGVELKASGLSLSEGQAQGAPLEGRGASLTRVELGGAGGDLWLALLAPPTLELERSHRVAFSLSALRKAAQGAPAEWSALLQEAFLCPTLEVEVSLEPAPAGFEPLRALVQRPGREVSGAEVELWLEHLSTSLDESLAGSPRRSERLRLHLRPHGEAESQRALELRALFPGTLQNEPERLRIQVRGRLRRAIPAAKWPAGRERPELARLGGVPFVFDPTPQSEGEGPAEASFSLSLVYERRAPDGAEAPPAPGEALGVRQAGGARAPAGERAALVGEAARRLAAREWPEAETAARTLLAQAPSEAEPWALLAQVALGQERTDLARARATLALSRGERGDAGARAQLVLGRVALLAGRIEEAGAALRAAQAAGASDPQVLAELARLAEEL